MLSLYKHRVFSLHYTDMPLSNKRVQLDIACGLYKKAIQEPKDRKGSKTLEAYDSCKSVKDVVATMLTGKLGTCKTGADLGSGELGLASLCALSGIATIAVELDATAGSDVFVRDSTWSATRTVAPGDAIYGFRRCENIEEDQGTEFAFDEPLNTERASGFNGTQVRSCKEHPNCERYGARHYTPLDKPTPITVINCSFSECYEKLPVVEVIVANPPHGIRNRGALKDFYQLVRMKASKGFICVVNAGYAETMEKYITSPSKKSNGKRLFEIVDRVTVNQSLPVVEGKESLTGNTAQVVVLCGMRPNAFKNTRFFRTDEPPVLHPPSDDPDEYNFAFDNMSLYENQEEGEYFMAMHRGDPESHHGPETTKFNLTPNNYDFVEMGSIQAQQIMSIHAQAYQLLINAPDEIMDAFKCLEDILSRNNDNYEQALGLRPQNWPCKTEDPKEFFKTMLARARGMSVELSSIDYGKMRIIQDFIEKDLNIDEKLQ